MTNPLAAIYAFWMSTPAPIRTPLQAGFVSALFSLGTVAFTDFGNAVTQGAAGSPSALLQYMVSHAWGCFIGFMGGAGMASAFRAWQAKIRVANTITLADGTTAVITKAGPK